jgi:flavorubredoxin
MPVQKICERVFSVGARDWDRRIFDELIPLPHGTSYNSYWIEGSEKNALIDSVDPAKKDELFSNLKKLNVKKIDYLVSNHAEQDHSGTIPDLLEIFPRARVVTNEKCKNFLIDLLRIPEDRFQVVKDGDTLSLGDKTLEFVFTPWVHWPETMCTILKQDKILFSCDFFGSHLATSHLFVRDHGKVINGAKRYYAEIMMPFRTIIKKNIEKIEQLEFDMIAPSHGPVYRESKIIIDAYRNWVSDRVENEVVIAYVSMHGSTERMIHYLVEKMMERGISVKPFNLTRTDIGELAMSLVDAATLIVGTPTVLAGPHPAAVYAATLVNALKPKLKFATVVGSFGWGGQTVEIIKNNMNHLKVEFLPPVLIKGLPGEDGFKMLDALTETIFAKHKEITFGGGYHGNHV